MKEEEELTIDLGKVKKFFSKLKIKEEQEKIEDLTEEKKELQQEAKKAPTPVKEHLKEDIKQAEASIKEEKQELAEFNLDLSKAKNFLWQHKTLVVLLLLLVIQFVPNNDGALPWGGIWMRMQTQELPIADTWAKDSVHNTLKNQIRNEVNKQYPNLPDANKNNLVDEEFKKLLKEQKSAVDQQVQGTAQFLRSQFQYEENGKTWLYMPDIDPYFYLRFARNYLDHGYIGDKMVNGQQVDDHSVAPIGKIIDPKKLHPYLLAFQHKILSVFSPDAPLMQTAAYFPIIFTLLSMIPVFFITRRFGGIVGGIFAASMLILNPSITGRTPWGHADTDAYNVFFPVLIAWLFLEAVYAKGRKKKIMLSSAAGFFVGLFALAWGGWWYVFDFAVGTLGIYLAYLVFVHRAHFKSIWKLAEVQNTLLVAGVFIISSGIFVTLFKSFNTFYGALLGPFSFTIIKAAAHPSLWPNVYTTVAELNPLSIPSVLSTFGKFLSVIAVLGIIITIIGKDEHGKRNIIYAVFLTIWSVGTVYASTKGVRFAMLLVPAFSISFGVAIGAIHNYMVKYAKKEFGVKQIITSIILIVVFSILLVNPAKASYSSTRGDVPLMNDAWYNSLQAIKQDSAEDAIITSWWDFGHHWKYLADRAVTFDGASQNTPLAHWVGKLFQSSDEQVSIGILRMLDCGSNNAFEEVNKVLDNTPLSVRLINKLIVLDKSAAHQLLQDEGFTEEQAENVLLNTHCNPPQAYVITSDDMVAKSGVWGHFGSWNFERADTWINLRHQSRDTAVAQLQDYGYDEDAAEKLYFDAQAITDEGEANGWIAPWPGYASGVQGCRTEQGMSVCGNGLIVNLSNYEAAIQANQAQGRPRSLVYINENNEVIERFFNDSNVGLSGVLIPDGKGFKSVIAAPELANSMFTRLFFMEGHGLKHFKKLSSERQITGGDVIVWTVDWQGGEANIKADLKPKESVSAGDTVGLSYVGYFDNGTIFDSSIPDWSNKNITTDINFDAFDTQPLTFEAGARQVIPGFDKAVIGLTKGELKTVIIPPEEAYGTDPEAHLLGNKTLHFRFKIEAIS